MPQLKAAIAELQSQGYDLPDYPESPDNRRGARRPRPLRQGQGLGGQPGPARGQLRPPRAGVGQELRHERTRTGWAPGPPTPRPTSPRWASTTSAPTRRRSSIEADDTLRIEHVGRRRHRDRAEGVGARARRRGRRRHVHGRRRAPPLPHRADRPGQGRRRAVLGAPQGHDDEGLRPDPVRARGAGVLPDAVRAVRRGAEGRRDLAQRRARRAALGRGLAARGRRDRRRRHAGPRRRPRDGDGRLRQGDHQPARPLRRDHRRLDAGDDPPVRPHVGPGRRGGRHPRGHPGLVVRRRLPDRARRLPRPRRLRPGHHGLGARTSA